MCGSVCVCVCVSVCGNNSCYTVEYNKSFFAELTNVQSNSMAGGKQHKDALQPHSVTKDYKHKLIICLY